MLMQDKNIRTGGSSGLYYFTVLCSYANFRTSYKRMDGISYTIYPGEWICRVSELTEWFRNLYAPFYYFWGIFRCLFPR